MRPTNPTRNQDAEETVESYITTLRKMAKTCNFGRLEDRLLRDRVVMGIRDGNLRSNYSKFDSWI